MIEVYLSDVFAGLLITAGVTNMVCGGIYMYLDRPRKPKYQSGLVIYSSQWKFIYWGGKYYVPC